MKAPEEEAGSPCWRVQERMPWDGVLRLLACLCRGGDSGVPAGMRGYRGQGHTVRQGDGIFGYDRKSQAHGVFLLCASGILSA